VNFDDLILELNAAADHWMNRAKVAEAEQDRLARQVEAMNARVQHVDHCIEEWLVHRPDALRSYALADETTRAALASTEGPEQ
jgi:hypothetical protein